MGDGQKILRENPDAKTSPAGCECGMLRYARDQLAEIERHEWNGKKELQELREQVAVLGAQLKGRDDALSVAKGKIVRLTANSTVVENKRIDELVKKLEARDKLLETANTAIANLRRKIQQLENSGMDTEQAYCAYASVLKRKDLLIEILTDRLEAASRPPRRSRVRRKR